MEANVGTVGGQQTVTAGPNGSITIGSLQGIGAVGGQANKYNNQSTQKTRNQQIYHNMVADRNNASLGAALPAQQALTGAQGMKNQMFTGVANQNFATTTTDFKNNKSYNGRLQSIGNSQGG